jgi:NAD-dependent SIR2 family protein deacetylase
VTCTHCGAADPDSYVLRFSPEGRDAQRLELKLCDDCLERFLGEGNAELVSPNIVAIDSDPSDESLDGRR